MTKTVDTKRLRRRLGLEQEDLAWLVDCHARSIQRWEASGDLPASAPTKLLSELGKFEGGSFRLPGSGRRQEYRLNYLSRSVRQGQGPAGASWATIWAALLMSNAGGKK